LPSKKSIKKNTPLIIEESKEELIDKIEKESESDKEKDK
jgi:hypothetical protein